MILRFFNIFDDLFVCIVIVAIIGAGFIIFKDNSKKIQEIESIIEPPCIKYTLSDGKTTGEILNVERAIYAKDKDCYIIYADGNIYVLCNCSIIFYNVIPAVQYHSPVIEY